MKGSVATVSKEQLLSMEDGYGYNRYQKPGICVTTLQVLKIILYVELVLFFGLFFIASLYYSMPRNYYHEDNTSFDLDDDIYNANDTERPVLCEVTKTDGTSQEVTEVPEMLVGDETTMENEFRELKSSEILNGTDDSEYHYLRLGPIVFRWSKGENDESFSVEQDEVRRNEETETATESAENLIVNCDDCNKQGDSREEIHVTTSKDELTEMEEPEQSTTPHLEEVFEDKVTPESEHERMVETIIDQLPSIDDFLMPHEYGTNDHDKPMFDSRIYNDYNYYD